MVLYGVGAVVALWLTSTVVGAVNHVPLVRICGTLFVRDPSSHCRET